MPPAARLGDMHTCPLVNGLVPHVGGPISGPCALNVLIGGQPAARISDMAICVGPPPRQGFSMGTPRGRFSYQSLFFAGFSFSPAFEWSFTCQ